MASDVIFGPVPSRRLGISLGVDIVPIKVCSFDCVYCELGLTTVKTAERKEYIPKGEVDAALQEYFAKDSGSAGGHLDYVTFSGSGEPTLHSDLSNFIDKVKSLTDTPVAVLTNGSLLPAPQVRKDLMRADLVIPSLDAATQHMFARINRPVHGVQVAEIIEGARLFAAEFPGEIWLEIMIVEGMNDSPSEIEALVEAASRINPTRVQIGTVVRPPAESGVRPVDGDELQRIASRFQGRVDVIPTSRRTAERDFSRHQAERVIAMLRIRPVTLDDLCRSLGMHRAEVLKYLGGLGRDYPIKTTVYQGQEYFTIEDVDRGGRAGR